MKKGKSKDDSNSVQRVHCADCSSQLATMIDSEVEFWSMIYLSDCLLNEDDSEITKKVGHFAEMVLSTGEQSAE